MTCHNRSSNPDNRSLNQQEHRNISRLWQTTIRKLSQSRVNFHQSYFEDESRDEREFHGSRAQSANQTTHLSLPQRREELEDISIPEIVKKKLGKGKSMAKKKSPLQKFDEVVTGELTNRRMAEEAGMSSFEGCKKWAPLKFCGSKLSDFGRSKISVENKISRGALFGVEKELKSEGPLDVQNAALMDAIEKLAQAQAFCRFDAAVKAAEAATASVPPELAEEVAVACAKDYQSEIVDVFNEQIPSSEDRKPLEVIGYIGVTKLKDNL